MRERIIEFLKSENKTSAQFADEIGVQPSGVSHILSGRNKPSLDFVLKMLKKYKFLSTEWLLFGKGTMYREPEFPDLFSQPAEHIPDKNENEKIYIDTEKDNIQDKKTDVQETKDQPEVEKIVWFYNNNRFREFYPRE